MMTKIKRRLAAASLLFNAGDDRATSGNEKGGERYDQSAIPFLPKAG
jgi:hypothetical protein